MYLKLKYLFNNCVDSCPLPYENNYCADLKSYLLFNDVSMISKLVDPFNVIYLNHL